MRFVKWLTQYNKFLVAMTMALVYFLQDYYQVELPVDQTTVESFWMFISAILVFLVPNGKAEEK
jgi:hypothetical protein